MRIIHRKKKIVDLTLKASCIVFIICLIALGFSLYYKQQYTFADTITIVAGIAGTITFIGTILNFVFKANKKYRRWGSEEQEMIIFNVEHEILSKQKTNH
jgi:TRAP-type C4-dicarboxylate transport system permease small subunit